MPKGAKPAPPQQSNLLDMWKSGKRKAAAEPKKEEDVDETMDDNRDKPGKLRFAFR